jgi:hypothetical protein
MLDDATTALSGITYVMNSGNIASGNIKLYANREINFEKKLIFKMMVMVFTSREWNLDIPKPTLAQIEQYESQANKLVESNQVQVQTE